MDEVTIEKLVEEIGEENLPEELKASLLKCNIYIMFIYVNI